jgi:hypothetical protein
MSLWQFDAQGSLFDSLGSIVPALFDDRNKYLLFAVRREKGALVQWEEGIPPGNCRSSRKQPEWLSWVTGVAKASGGKGPFEGISERAGPNE